MSKLKLGLIGGLIALLVVLAVRYFRTHTVAVLSPHGPIAAQQRDLIVTVTAIMLIVVIPVFIMTFAFAWKYRAANTTARYTPDWDRNRLLEATWWAIPTAIIAVLAVITWKSSYALDPYKPIAAANPTMTIQVVALDWKWLFIYPEQNLATVNYARIPVNTPVDFQITSDAPMNSFWVPQLGGQIYAMPGMSAQLNLMASTLGRFRGSSANISGAGFAGMNFTVESTSRTNFDTWATGARSAPQALTTAAYQQLARPSQNNPVALYRSPAVGLYDTIMNNYMGPDMESMSLGGGAP